ncbi:PREDICTED: BON1-associated protein 2-like [Camelina sativa]|uniref:BON1-associated protein 2-like n=1 Tax=Camelina sativa TaxID=90675 RepID=A0ABM1QTU8_CAMSA|nr:PREDICTED: BON1-associated protein 2-like [Camelina sativa]
MSRKIQITGISAEDLVYNRRPVKKNAVVAFGMAGNYWKHPMRTSVDETGGDYPMWEDKLETEFPSGKELPTVMYVEVSCRSSGEDKRVGTARVPVKDFTGEYAPEGFLHCLSYRLWDDYGKRNGIVNFSVRIVPKKSDLKSGLRPFWLR